MSQVRRHVEFRRLHNFRDLGGYCTQDGRTVRWGRLYRSDSLAKLQPGANPDRKLTWPGYGRAPAQIMRLFLTDITAAHGSMHEYAINHLEIDETLVSQLGTRLLLTDGIDAQPPTAAG